MKYQKIIALLDRNYLYPDPIALTEAMLAAEPTGMVFDLNSKAFPYSGNVNHEASYRDVLHSQLNRCDSANVDAWLGCANISKFHNGQPVGIPTFHSDNPLDGAINDGSFHIISAGKRRYESYSLPTSHAWNLPLEILQGSVRLDWYRGTDDSLTPAVKAEKLEAGTHLLQLHSLEATEWTLQIRALTDTEVILYPIVQREIAVNRHQVYDYRGIGWLKCRGPEHSKLFELAVAHKARMASILQEFWQTEEGTITPIHTSLKGGFIFSDEFEGTHWSEKSRAQFHSAAHAAVTHLNLACAQAYHILGGKPLFFGDIFGHNRTQYNRTNNPDNGGFAHSLDYLPAKPYGIPIMWYEGNDPQKIFNDFKEIARRDIPYLLGHQLGQISGEAAAEALNLASAANLTLPIGSFCFGWDRSLFTTENLRREFALMPENI